MNKAFIFDMDGVLIDTESEWEKEPDFFEQLYGAEINKKLDNSIGYSIESLYKKAQSYGFSLGEAEHFRRYDEKAKEIYARAKLTPKIPKLISYLKSQKFKIGLVSASPQSWIDQTLARIPEKFDLVISLDARDDLKYKPEPDGYVEAIKVLGAKPENTIILEDSNAGIASAKASSAFVIGFQENLTPGYKQEGADVYAKDIDEVFAIVENQLKESANLQ